ncbi:MAG: hypothetical protein ACREDF_00885, partial [Thermoplasmata archaeon]
MDQRHDGPFPGRCVDGDDDSPYTSSQFAYNEAAGVAANAYVLEVVFLLVLGSILALFSLGYSRTLPTVSWRIVG